MIQRRVNFAGLKIHLTNQDESMHIAAFIGLLALGTTLLVRSDTMCEAIR